jgi:methionine salvage enolase-phosphatase E1
LIREDATLINPYNIINISDLGKLKAQSGGYERTTFGAKTTCKSYPAGIFKASHLPHRFLLLVDRHETAQPHLLHLFPE